MTLKPSKYAGDPALERDDKPDFSEIYKAPPPKVYLAGARPPTERLKFIKVGFFERMISVKLKPRR